LAFYDPAFQAQKFRLYPWCIKFHQDFADKPKRQKMVRVVAPNGSGKSSQILAPAACWTASMFNESQTAITSASNEQLDKQTMRAAKRLAENMNTYHQAELWDSQGRKMRFCPTGSLIDARKSDEENLQEGFHPMVPGGEFTILIDEAKSIPEPVYKGIMKWTGWTRRADVSSAGDPLGMFYREICEDPRHHKVTIDDCPHISEEEREAFIKAAGGITSPLVRQAFYSEFAALAGSVVIILEDVLRAVRMAKENAIKHIPSDHNEAGLDLSGGGDETVLAVGNGNKLIALEACPFHREDQIETHIAEVLIPKYNLRLEHIRADAGGMGRAMSRNISAQVRKSGGRGENMVLIYNQKAPRGILKENFGNRGTEMWHYVANLIRDHAVILLDDSLLVTQLANRNYRQMLTNDKIIIEPKGEARVNGRPSPDRADSVVLLFESYGKSDLAEKPKERRKMSADELEAWCDDLNDGKFAHPRHGLQVVTLDDVLAAGRMNRMIKER